MALRKTKIKNEDGTEVEVPSTAVKHYEEVGWTVVDDGSSESEPERPELLVPEGEESTDADQLDLFDENPERKDQ